mmetsp:Transcript_61836/g.181319  ORF Transcript_61836/g.181319 Transcript_61836/m.181319 type:complete len:207 (-) Transcript_61836:79-699(-)
MISHGHGHRVAQHRLARGLVVRRTCRGDSQRASADVQPGVGMGVQLEACRRDARLREDHGAAESLVARQPRREHPPAVAAALVVAGVGGEESVARGQFPGRDHAPQTAQSLPGHHHPQHPLALRQGQPDEHVLEDQHVGVREQAAREVDHLDLHRSKQLHDVHARRKDREVLGLHALSELLGGPGHPAGVRLVERWKLMADTRWRR